MQQDSNRRTGKKRSHIYNKHQKNDPQNSDPHIPKRCFDTFWTKRIDKLKDMSSSEEEKPIKVHIRRKSYYVRFPDAEGSPFLNTEEPKKKRKEKKSETTGNPSYRRHRQRKAEGKRRSDET